MNQRIRLSLLVTILVGLIFYLFAMYKQAPFDKALMLSLTGGVLAGGWVYLFYYTGRQNKKEFMGIAEGSEAKVQGAASHFHDGEEVGGTMFLFEEYLVFQSHTFSLRRHELRIPLKDIRDVGLFEKYGHREGGLKVVLQDGQTVRFGSKHATRWMERIEEIVDQHLPE
jgi:hypothetical protein